MAFVQAMTLLISGGFATAFSLEARAIGYRKRSAAKPPILS